MGRLISSLVICLALLGLTASSASAVCNCLAGPRGTNCPLLACSKCLDFGGEPRCANQTFLGDAKCSCTQIGIHCFTGGGACCYVTPPNSCAIPVSEGRGPCAWNVAPTLKKVRSADARTLRTKKQLEPGRPS